MRYEEWFERDVWSARDAALLLYGLDPERCAKSGSFHWDELSQYHEYSSETLEGILHDVECDIHNEVVCDKSSYLCLPLRACQWAKSVGHRFYFCEAFMRFAYAHFGELLDDDGWIDRNYDHWSKQDAWSIEAAVDLIAGYQVDRGYEYPTPQYRSYRQQMREMLEKAMIGNVMKQIIRDGRTHVIPQEVVTWALSKGIVVPRKLIKVMRMATTPASRTKVTAVREVDKSRIVMFRNLLPSVKESVRWHYGKELDFARMPGNSEDFFLYLCDVCAEKVPCNHQHFRKHILPHLGIQFRLGRTPASEKRFWSDLRQKEQESNPQDKVVRMARPHS